MPGTNVTSMRDLVPEDAGTIHPAPLAKLRDFLCGIVRAATATPLAEFISGIQCRRRPGNRPCLGSIAVRKTDRPEPFVFWECTVCGDNGRISDFRAGPDDLSGVAKRKLDRAGQTRDVILTAEEYRSWISGDMVPYDVESMQSVYAAVAEKRGILISALEDELATLRDAASADANHESNRKRKTHLESISDKLGSVQRKPRTRHLRRKRPSQDAAGSIVAAESAYAHGFFSALIAGPMVMPTRWLQHFISKKHESIEDLNASAQHVMSVYNEIADVLSRRRQRFGEATLTIARMDPRGDALVDWQRGFLEAMELSPDEWMNLLSRQPKDILQPLAVIAQCTSDPSKHDWLKNGDLRENLGRSLGVMTARLWEAFRNEPSVQLEFGQSSERRPKPKASRMHHVLAAAARSRNAAAARTCASSNRHASIAGKIFHRDTAVVFAWTELRRASDRTAGLPEAATG